MQSLKTNSTMEGGYSATSAASSPPVAPMIEIPDEKDQRFCVLSYEQVKRLNDLMSEVLSIDGRGNFPTIEVKLRDLVSVVRRRLEDDHGVKVKEVRLNGSGASSVLAADFASVDRDSDGNTSDDIAYNDLDLIFSVDLSTGRAYDRVKCAVLESLMQLLPEGVSRKRMSSCSMKEAYVSKMVKVNDNSDRWSLITLGNNRSKSVELKFVHTMRRQYEFSVDSFHVLLDTLFLFYECADAAAMPIGDAFYPTVVGESMYGDFGEALYHLRRKLIATRSPEEIRGGGLLKYCNLLCKGYRPAWPQEVKNMERYMCSRFFIDFPDMPKQQAKLENYLYNHFQGAEDRHKYEYLMILYHVVDESTVCLMGHERRLTLALIEDIAYQLYPDGFSDYAASSSSSSTSDSSDHPNLLSPMSMSDACSTISSASSVSSSGYTTPQKPETPGPSQPQMAPVLTANATTATTVQHSNGTSAATVITTTGHHALNTAIPPPNHPASQQQQQQQHQQQPTPASLIPTYEIVTSCQPAVVYSNGYYYTSFVQQQQPGSATQNANSSSTASPTLQVSTLTTTGPCLACSCGQQQQQQQWPVVASVGKKSNNRQQQHHRQQQQRHHQNKQHHHQQQPPLHHQKLISS